MAMRKLLGLVLIVVLALFAFACSTSNVGDNLAPEFEDRGAAFVVQTEDTGLGSYSPALTVKDTGSSTVVTIEATEALDLSAVAFNLKYDSSRFSPEKVEMGSFLGSEDEVLSFSLTNQADIVPVSIVQANGLGAEPADGRGQLATITFRNTPFSGVRNASSTPSGASNTVDDLELVQNGGSDELTWTEKNAGDYNIDGVVSAQDLTPIGVSFGQQVATGANPAILRIVDGSGDGTINVQDLTTIGVNFGHKITGYMLFTSETGSPEGGDIWAPRSEQTRESDKPMIYHVPIDLADFSATSFWVAPVSNDDMDNPGPKSNEAEAIVFDPGAPLPPTNLTAEGSEAIGDRTILLNWTGSTSNDVDFYNIEWKLSSEADSAYVVFGTTADGPTTSISITNPAFVEADYDFRLQAIDRENPANSSVYSNVATATPYIAPVILPVAPTGLAAAPGAGALSIHLTWTTTSDGLANRYYVYRKGPAESSFTKIGQTVNAFIDFFDDNDGLTEGETYEYYVTAFNNAGSLESLESTHASSIPSAAIVFDVTGITNTKTTHNVDGSEPATTLTVSCNTTPDSVNWSANPNIGSFTGSGPSVTWKPSGSPQPQVVTITASATFGAQNDSATTKIYLTNESIKTEFADRGGAGNRPVGDPAGSGIMPDFSLDGLEYLQPLSQGGAVTDTTSGFGQFKDWVNGRVALVNRWELWCGPCKAELPGLDDIAEHFGDADYVMFAYSSDPAPYEIVDIKPYFQTNNLDYVYQFHSKGGTDIHNPAYSMMGYDGYIPFNVLLDRDGNCRWVGGNAEGTHPIIAQLTGLADL